MEKKLNDLKRENMRLDGINSGIHILPQKDGRVIYIDFDTSNLE